MQAFELVRTIKTETLPGATTAKTESNRSVQYDLKTENIELSGKGELVPSQEAIEKAKSQQKKTILIVTIVVLAISAASIYYFTRKKG